MKAWRANPRTELTFETCPILECCATLTRVAGDIYSEDNGSSTLITNQTYQCWRMLVIRYGNLDASRLRVRLHAKNCHPVFSGFKVAALYSIG
jgi:hypothetical protein